MKSVVCYFKLEVQSEKVLNGSVSCMKCYQVRPVRKVENKEIYFVLVIWGKVCVYMQEKSSLILGGICLGLKKEVIGCKRKSCDGLFEVSYF